MPVVALALGPACNAGDRDTGADEATDAGSTAVAETDDPTGGACSGSTSVDACCCFASGGNFVETVCTPLAETCAKVDLSCGSDLDGPEGATCTAAVDEAAVDCALQALAAGDAGRLELSFHADGFYWYETLVLHMQGDGTVYKVESTAVDASEVYDPTGRFALRPASYFSDCLAEDLAGKAACLRAPVMGEITEQCLGEIVNQDI